MNMPGLPRILVVDDSRMVRASIIKLVRGRFEVREEGDGEAGWEALVIDPDIRIVISDLSMPKLDGYGLVDRIRAANIERIRRIPVIMISGEEDELARQRARDLGATDFITKGIGTAELLARLETLMQLHQSHEELQDARAQAATDHASGLLSRAVVERQAEQAVHYAQRHGTPLGVLVFGLDRYEDLADAMGAEAADALMVQIAKRMPDLVRHEDSLGRWADDRLALVAAGIDARETRVFAERLREAVARATIRHKGLVFQATATIGIASLPADEAVDAAALLAIAEQRLARGIGEGGNRVVGDNLKAAPAPVAAIDQALADLAVGRDDLLRARLPMLGVRLLPLLQLMETEFRFGLPLQEMAQRWGVASSTD